MSSVCDASPPKYSDPSAADDISSLISTALAVQEGLFNARKELERVDSPRVKEFLPRLVDTDERYLKLLNESRTSATHLYSAIQNFMDVTIPISQDTACPMEERIATVEDFAGKIATSAEEGIQYYDKQVENLKETLNQLVVELTQIETTPKTHSNFTNNPKSTAHAQLAGATLKATDKPNKDSYQRPIDSTALFKHFYSVLDWLTAPKCKEKATVGKGSKATTSSSDAVQGAVLGDISALVDLFSNLIGKLGFGAVWRKLVLDAGELSAYLSTGTDDQEGLHDRVQAEVGVYEKIKQALDDYCLRTA